MTQYAYFNGSIVPMAEANVSIACNTLHYGTGCFGGLRGYWNEEKETLYTFRLVEHYKRFLNSAKLLMCNFDYTPEELRDITLELLAREGWRENVYIRPLAYKDDGIYRVWLHDGNDKVAIFSQPVSSYLGEKMLNVCVSSWRRVDDTAIPARGKISGAYVNSALIKSDAVLSGYDEAVVLNQDGHVSEGSAANFMMVRDGVLITPPITSNLLEGITRRSILHLAQAELDLEVQEREIDRTELYIAEEAFFCGTGAQVSPIGSIDHRTVGDGKLGPVTEQIRDLYFDVVYGRNEKYLHWLSPVPQLEVA
ncbi:MAG: branched-chain amino acid transaminase [Ardenticatenaceae bacterium]|nr:branched-chain amino acid transaminase [Ardenticatenaceae bacterium]